VFTENVPQQVAPTKKHASKKKKTPGKPKTNDGDAKIGIKEKHYLDICALMLTIAKNNCRMLKVTTANTLQESFVYGEFKQY